MQLTGTQAMIPKARGIYAKRLTMAEYEELLRRRTVPEVAAFLKKHPYFRDSLATLSTTDPHRGQIEELMNMDIFQKYEAIIHYDQTSHSFSEYYLVECELREILKMLHLLSIASPGAYLSQMPPYLTGRLHFDLFAMAQVRSFAALVELLRGTIFARALRARLAADPRLRNYPLTEAALLQEYYEYLFASMARSFSGRELEAVHSLFSQEAEIYNLDLIRRVKTYFPRAYTPADIQKLLLPHTHRLPKRKMLALTEASGPEAFYQQMRRISGSQAQGVLSPEELDSLGGKVMYRYARRMLHLTSSPAAALAAFLTLAKLERENMVNIVEGTRYNLPPEKIRPMLRH